MLKEEQLIYKCIRNDRVGQRILFDRYYRLVYSIIYRYLSNHHDTEDQLVVVFNNVFSKLNNFNYQGEGSLKSWISKIAINQAIQFLRSKQKLVFTGLLDELNIQDVEPEEPMNLDMVKQIKKHLKNLPEGYKTIFQLKVIEGYTHQEISEILMISRNTSKSQFIKAKKKLLSLINLDYYGLK